MPLVNTTEMFKKAYEGGYAIGAFNVNNMEIVQGIIDACKELKAPRDPAGFRLGARKYARHAYLYKLVQAAVEETGLPIALHLDHGASFELCKDCIDGGFTSVMIDGSHLPYEENVAVTKQGRGICPCPRRHRGGRAGPAGRRRGRRQRRGRQGLLHRSRSGAGFCHPHRRGLPGHRHRHQPRRVTSSSPARSPSCASTSWRRSCRSAARLPHRAARRVLRHARSMWQMINQYGGQMPDAIGIPEDMLRKAAQMAVCKINVDSDLRLAMTAGVRKHFAENPTHFDPRQYLGEGRDNITKVVKHKIEDVLGSANRA